MDQVVGRDGKYRIDLPEEWQLVHLGDIAHLRGTKVHPAERPELKFVGMDDIAAEGMAILQSRPFTEMKSAGNYFEPGDVLYGRLRPYLNKTSIATFNGAASGELLAIVPSEAIEGKLLQYFMHAKSFVNRAMGTISGDRPRIDFETIAGFDFPLPPLAEQQRIVARVDALFAEIAEGEAALAEARIGLETFRRALLKAAVTGELTADWRAKNKPRETGHDLLARIKIERAAKGRGKRDAEVDKGKSSNHSRLPEGWAVECLSSLGKWTGGGTPSKSNPAYWKNGTVLWVSPKDMKSHEITDSLDKITEAAIADSSAKYVEPNSVLVVMRSGILRHTLPVAVNKVQITMNQDMRALSLFEGPSAEFVALSLRACQTEILSTCSKDGTTVNSIDSNALDKFNIPVPPPAEATEILRRVSEALSTAAETLAQLDAEATDAARLKQAILKAAFEGKLVPQDPTDEPASVLLARLKPTPSTAAPARRGRKTKT